MSDEEKRDDDAPDAPDADAGSTVPPEEQEEKGLGLTEEFARLEEEIRREVGADPATGERVEPEAGKNEPAGDEPAGDDPSADAGPADLDDEDGPAAGEWTAPAAAAGGGETEEWAVEDAEADGPEADAGEPVTDEPVAEEPPSEEIPTDEPESAEEPAPPSDDVEHTVVRRGPPPVPIAAAYYDEDDPVVKTPALWWRFLTASVLIIITVATAVAVSSLLLLTDVAAKLQPIPGLSEKLQEIGPGDPQTILIVGSDKRSNTPGDPGRSDTTMLLRVDPDKQVLSLFSLPRDLKVDIPGYGVGKLNEAYTVGGVKKTTETVKDLTGLDINHVVNVDFFGFAEAVNAIGCVYVDVDRHYFNDNSTALSDLDSYAAINVNAGYQRLCGQNALDYVRYRHTDTDIIRAARQQDFLRNARQQVPISEVLPIVGGDTGSDLIDIFTKYTSSDIQDPAQMIGALKAFLAVKDVPINQISFDGELGPSYVTATPDQISKAVDEFLNGKDTPGPSGGDNATKPDGGGSSGGGSGSKDKPKPESDPTSGADVISTSDVLDPETGINKFDAFGKTSARRLNFPIWVPTVVAPGSTYSADSRQYDIKDEDDNKQPAYKLVIEYTETDRLPEYYGVQGTTWSDPPILRDSHDTQSIDGRDFDIYYDGDRIRMIAWHDKDGNSYWVSNTLIQTLDNSEMMAIAASTKEIK